MYLYTYIVYRTKNDKYFCKFRFLLSKQCQFPLKLISRKFLFCSVSFYILCAFVALLLLLLMLFVCCTIYLLYLLVIIVAVMGVKLLYANIVFVEFSYCDNKYVAQCNRKLCIPNPKNYQRKTIL